MLRPIRTTPSNESGFSLVELMVGMVIGLLGMIVIMQVTVMFQAQKTATSSGSKAQNTGAIALYAMQREIEQAGYGISSTSILGCSLRLPSGATLTTLAPVLINDNSVAKGDSNTDTLLVAYGNPFNQTEGDAVNQHSTSNQYTVAAPLTFAWGDYVIFQTTPPPAPPCNLSLDNVTSINVPNSVVTVGTGTAMTSSTGTLFDLGPASAVKIHAYAVRKGVLTECDFMVNDCSLLGNTSNPSIWVPIAENIVSMKAQYGRDITSPVMDGIVELYDQGPVNTVCQLVRVPAMRMALVARSSQYQKNVVTTTQSNPGVPNAPTWAGEKGGGVPPIVGPNGNLGPGAAPDEPWKHYRYKVFETLIPLRNISWMGINGVVSGC